MEHECGFTLPSVVSIAITPMFPQHDLSQQSRDMTFDLTSYLAAVVLATARQQLAEVR